MKLKKDNIMWKILNCSLHENIELCNVIISRFQNQLTLVNFTNVAALCQGKSRSREIFGGRWPPNTHYFLLSSLLSFLSSIMIYHHYPNDHDKVMRYVNLSTLLVYRLVSGKVLAYLCPFSLKYYPIVFSTTKNSLFGKTLRSWQTAFR